MNFQLLGWYDLVCFVILFLAAVVMMWSVDRGMGWKYAKPYGPEGPKDSTSLSPAISFVTAAMYLAKSLDFFSGGGSAFSLNRYWYLDYSITCPMIMLDFALTINMRHKLRLTIFCWLLLVCAAATFLVDSPERECYYAAGVTCFVLYFIWLRTLIIERLTILPEAGKEWLVRAVIIFFTFWPMFPTAWLFSWQSGGPLSEQTYFLIHGVLDIVCKAGYGLCMTMYRMTLEDYYIDKFAAQGADADGSSDSFPAQIASVKLDMRQLRRASLTIGNPQKPKK